MSLDTKILAPNEEAFVFIKKTWNWKASFNKKQVNVLNVSENSENTQDH